ncbi:aminotransferase class V-fold PLP-dependent enzyme [Flavobacterium sp. ASW18X]|uniref:aminotransferase class V-fold PLP-dependent enzyme n=1 Tax=Flavobacterium sp. ASW18X TaxID=2572595 RepID=UPI0010AE8E47|nr:aminotransferase class V-fold PLP-dependent enzyme [Flavobacterium sp. ASW18X]TKD66702.1 aminotransferase class V-fold PLP-dependent enzyme [Flavobacterium sp. ASW18X]
MELSQIRKQFPVFKRGIYANTAATGPMFEDLYDWRQDKDLDLFLKASSYYNSSVKIVEETRMSLKRFFNCEDKDVALIPNFSWGINSLLSALNTKQHILCLEDDYPSLIWPLQGSEHRLTAMPITATIEEDIINTVKQKEITLLAVSITQWLSGLLLQPSFFAGLKAIYPELIIVVDATQYCGMFPLDFKASKIDVVIASGYKWMLGGYGNGFMLFSDAVKLQLNPTMVGFGSVSGDSSKKNKIPFYKHFEPGHLDALSFGSLGQGIQLMEELGVSAIYEQNSKLSAYAKETFTALGALDELVAERRTHSTIFRLKGGETLFNALAGHDIAVALREGYVRVSFHFYNTRTDVDAIAGVISKS